MNMEKPKCMKDLALFAALSPAERQQVTLLAGKKTYQKGEMVFHEGQPADTIYLVKSGRIRLFKLSEEGKEITLDILRADDIFGENAIFDEQLHSMSAQALESSFVCTCTRGDFERMIMQNPAVALKLIKALGEKLNNYTVQIADMAFRDVKGRLLNTLQRLAQDYGKPNGDGLMIIISLTHQDLANLVNASRVMVTNTLNRLKQEGLISMNDNYIVVKSHGSI
ncbi:MAG: Anaerobic regulatory protein [Pelotomaculum sp. PtaB.Bin104]|nr:MAG: Anaerobic regulatory protein [Pelotomaculum sp. PtaB.Bin104]